MYDNPISHHSILASATPAYLGMLAEHFLNWLGTFGKQPGGGVTRLLYTREWMQAQHGLSQQMNNWGFDTHYDAVGNLFGRIHGSASPDQTILTGSHIDTVSNGGRYDGAYGIVAGMIAMHYLKEAFGSPKRSLEVVSLCEEEGSRFPITYWGSGHVTGFLTLDQAEGITDHDGIELLDAMKHAGFGNSDLSDVRTDIQTFIELHVEQGSVLEEGGYSIGIVEQIVGQKRYRIEVIGEANHAGTTPMHLRKDALLGANAMIYQLFRLIRQMDAPFVATVGRMELEPNISNVIPSKATFTVDIRHPDTEILNQFCMSMLQTFEQIAEDSQVGMNMNVWLDEPSVHMDPNMVQDIERICNEKGITNRRMPSGAGHDSKLFVPHCPTSLLFVPSHRGVSHSPLEYTSPDELGQGIQVLIQLLYKLGYEN